MRKTLLLILISIAIFPLVFGSGIVYSTTNPSSKLTPEEREITTRIDGTTAYNYDLELERMTLNQSISGFSFRSAGSSGATATAQWIKKQFESFGLETEMESFEFTTWNLPSQPTLVIDDSNFTTTINQETIESFQSAHLSLPTPSSGVVRDVVILPLPYSPNADFLGPLNRTAWAAINITDKILLVGREVRRNADWGLDFKNKLMLEKPAVIIYTWWYSWMSFTPPMFGSSDGMYSGFQPDYWGLGVPVGWVDYEDGLLIREKALTHNLSANVTIPAVIGTGPHYNVIGKMKGSVDPNRIIIISAHYDSVMTSGFCDNGAGVAGILELARVFSEAAKTGLYTPRYTLLFAAFAAEEMGFVGSINFIKQHEAEINNVTAVVNLDSIGSDSLEISRTFPNDNGLDLDEVVLKAAADLNTEAELIDPGGSDQEAFRNPASANAIYYYIWQLDSGIYNTTRVKASVMISSYPLFYSSKWDDNSTPGWIHTRYDNSTSTTSLNWVRIDNLELQIQVAGLSVLRVLSGGQSPLLSQILAVTMVLSVVVMAVGYVKRSWVTGTLKKAYRNILYFIEMKDLVIILGFTALLLFISYISSVRVITFEIMQGSWPVEIMMAYYGFPFEMIGIQQKLGATASVRQQSDSGFSPVMGGGYDVPPQIVWEGLFLNLVLCLLIAFALTYTFERLKDSYNSRRQV